MSTHLSRVPELKAELATLRADAETMAHLIAGYWPGIEDGIMWPRPDPDDHPALLAARRVLGLAD